ncbi:MAG: phospho-sugar mutase [Ornithinimicrobium sp.]
MSRRDDLVARARAWRDDDPDDTTRAELDELLARLKTESTSETTSQPATTSETESVPEDGEAYAELTDRFAGLLAFGTAGLRGALGAGPNRMNRAVVIRAAAGLTTYLQRDREIAAPRVVIGFDARLNSETFAVDTAEVVAGAGGTAMVLSRPLPTPVLAFAVRHLGADAGVMVTASHNPANDNGYKVYLGDGSQIVPPADEDIAARIEEVDRVGDVARSGQGWTRLGEEVLEAYLQGVVAVVEPDSSRELSLVHTALHGVGAEVVRRAFTGAGFAAPAPVEEQEHPDPAFSTVTFPNPEEAGAMDAALSLADATRPDAVIANDPDADRCAVAVPGPGGWRMLRGDEVGALLGHHMIRRGIDPDGDRTVLARSIVSSRLLGAMAAAAGLPAAETLTGFKWIGRVPGLVFGYEEALGYCVDPARVPDKDGVSAALLIAELLAGLRAQGRTVDDLLDELARAHGVYATDAFSVRVSDVSMVTPILARLVDSPPRRIGDVEVRSVEDLEHPDDDLPATPGVRFFLHDDTRVIVRPSGTEPKLKIYVEVIVDVPSEHELTTSRAEARRRLDEVLATMDELTRVG